MSPEYQGFFAAMLIATASVLSGAGAGVLAALAIGDKNTPLKRLMTFLIGWFTMVGMVFCLVWLGVARMI